MRGARRRGIGRDGMRYVFKGLCGWIEGRVRLHGGATNDPKAWC